MPEKTNVLMIMTDQHNFRAMSCIGHPDVKTPNLDRLAARGVLFDSAYCPAPICGPSRCSIFSGLFPSATGVTSNWIPYHDWIRPLPMLLRDGGYETALVGKLHHSPVAKDHGFSWQRFHDSPNAVYDPEEVKHSDYLPWLAERKSMSQEELVALFDADESSLKTDLKRFILGRDFRTEEEHDNSWVSNESICFLQKKHEKPFFLFTSYFGPHQPMRAPGRWAEMYDPAKLTLPEEFFDYPEDRCVRQPLCEPNFGRGKLSDSDYREILAHYYGQISMIDEGIGRILDCLREQGLEENTRIIFTADHGDYAGQFRWFFKGSHHEGSVRVPLIISDPLKKDTRGTTCRKVVSNLDLFETIRQFTGAPQSKYATLSRDLRPLLSQPDCGVWPSEAYSERHLGKVTHTMLARHDYKIICVSRADSAREFELYERRRVPLDGENLWDNPDYEKVRAELKAGLEGWMERAQGS